VSRPGAQYFLTWVTDQRLPVFADSENLAMARQHLAAIDESGDGSALAATIMPNHLHLLLELGSRLSLSEVVAKTKAGITRTCRGVKWQLNFFDHQLRPCNSAEDYAFYIFMNPYCAGICPLDQPWPGWLWSTGVRWAFEEKLSVWGESSRGRGLGRRKRRPYIDG
jgi:REP element-mobilizing transposase RayT